MKQVMERTLLAAGCLLGAIAVTKSCSDLLGTELEGGTITGRMLYAALIGKVLFLMTLTLAILWQRLAIVSAITASTATVNISTWMSTDCTCTPGNPASPTCQANTAKW